MSETVTIQQKLEYLLASQTIFPKRHAKVVKYIADPEHEEYEDAIEDIEHAYSRVTKRSKHKWTREETLIVTNGYIKKQNAQIIKMSVPYISLDSVKMKLKNCLYLDNGNVTGSLAHVSKLHKEVWYECHK
tara:strand:- start:84 stop:476 length:393 start_codon:yes stop_codon:yes gene_type:complete